MKSDSRLSGVLHLLLHMAGTPDPLTSDALAGAMGTHPVVVRRLLGGLRKRGLVASEKGHGGGWTLLRPLAEITLLDVYEALGHPPLLAMGNRRKAPECLLEQAVNRALDGALNDAEHLLLSRFGDVTLAVLEEDFRGPMAATGITHGHPGGHSHGL